MTTPRKKPRPTSRARPSRLLRDRIRRGAALIELSRVNVGGDDDDTTAAGDLVADLLHVLGPAHGRTALRVGLAHYLAEETDGDGPTIAALEAARDAL